MGVDCNNCKNKGKCGTSIALNLIRTGGKDAFVSCKSYEPKFFSVKCPNCDCIIHVDTTSKPQTNADRIRAMTDEELAAKIEELCQYTFMQISVYSKPFGKTEWLDWLKEEVKE